MTKAKDIERREGLELRPTKIALRALWTALVSVPKAPIDTDSTKK